MCINKYIVQGLESLGKLLGGKKILWALEKLVSIRGNKTMKIALDPAVRNL